MALNLASLRFRVVDVLSALAILAVGVFLAFIVRAAMRRSLAPRIPVATYKPMESLVFYSIIATFSILALYPLGLNLSSLIVAGGLTSLIIGLAAQNSLGNLISGIFLLIERPFRVGDPVSIGDVSGVVVNIGLLSTIIRTWEGTLARIPNNTVFGGKIVSYSGTRARRIEFTIGVSYDTDVEKAIGVIMKLVKEHSYCLVNPAPQVFVDGYGDSSINLKVWCWTPPQVWYSTKVELLTKIKRILEEAGIVIPYPQLDLHVRSFEAPIKVRVEGGRSD